AARKSWSLGTRRSSGARSTGSSPRTVRSSSPSRSPGVGPRDGSSATWSDTLDGSDRRSLPCPWSGESPPRSFRVDTIEPASVAFRRAQRRVLFATSACYLVYYTGRQNVGWAVAGIRGELGLSASEIGWISGAGLIVQGVAQIVSGHVADRAGGRRLLTLGAVASCALNWLTSFGNG